MFSALSVMFVAGSTTGSEICVTVTGVTDTIAEGLEVSSVTMQPSPANYIRDAPGGFTLTVTIEVVDNDGELNIRPVNLLEKETVCFCGNGGH